MTRARLASATSSAGSTALAPQDKFVAFARAFDTFSHFRAQGNAIGAFVVAFSVFEDRVTASFYLAKDASGERRPDGFVPLARKIAFLRGRGFVPLADSEMWKALAAERNHLFHEAMWNIDAFQIEHGERAIAGARLAEKVRRRLRRSLAREARIENPT